MTHSAVSYIGTRDINEDSCAVITSGNLKCCIVADGLGGHGKGEVASKLAVKAFETAFSNGSKPLEELFDESFKSAQKAILDEQKKLHNKNLMKTTVCALAIRDDELMWAHIGDSRVYAFAHGKVRSRTLDHSVPQMLVASKEIKEKDIRFHPDRNRLLRVLGADGETASKYELSGKKKLRKYQAFLLCTDGFWELVSEDDMERLLAECDTVEKWVRKMIKLAKKRGADGMDNCTAIGVWV